MKSARIILGSIVVIALVAASSADGGGLGPPGSESNPIVALPNPVATRVPPPNEGPRTAPGAQLAEPAKPGSSTRTQLGSAALHLSKPMEAQPETPRLQKEQPPSTSRPCSLVTKAEARQIVSAAIVEPLHAPQGPTCIYQAGAGKPHVTVGVQSASIDELRQLLQTRKPVTVAGQTAYCGTVGRAVLYVRLSDRQTLVIAAPCEMARQMATLAVERL